jgi:hypothetical protein
LGGPGEGEPDALSECRRSAAPLEAGLDRSHRLLDSGVDVEGVGIEVPLATIPSTTATITIAIASLPPSTPRVWRR